MGYSHCWILGLMAGLYGAIAANMLVGFILAVSVTIGLMVLTYKLLYGG